LKIGSRPEITANCGSLVIENVFTNLEPASFQKFQLVAATALSTNEGATAFLEQAGLEGFTVTKVTVALWRTPQCRRPALRPTRRP